MAVVCGLRAILIWYRTYYVRKRHDFLGPFLSSPKIDLFLMLIGILLNDLFSPTRDFYGGGWCSSNAEELMGLHQPQVNEGAPLWSGCQNRCQTFLYWNSP